MHCYNAVYSCPQEQKVATYENVERRMARTAEELLEEEEAEEEEEVVEEESDDEETVPYNPKNLPLGWDGKVSLCGHLWYSCMPVLFNV